MRIDRKQNQELESLLAAVRKQRLARGLRCKACQSTRIKRWGRFAQRQRYRCFGCGKTFSDLSDTAFAHAKRLHLQSRYLHCMRTGASVRRSARLTGIAPSTAFRWRHRLLDAARDADDVTIAGRVELAEKGFAHSEKGSRNLDRPPRRRGFGWKYYGHYLCARRVTAVIACDCAGTIVSAAVQKRPLLRTDVEHFIRHRVREPASVVTSYPTTGMYAAAARRCGLQYEQVIQNALSDTPNPRGNVKRYVKRLSQWLQRFRGVASRYLANYLIWHRFVDRRARALC